MCKICKISNRIRCNYLFWHPITVTFHVTEENIVSLQLYCLVIQYTATLLNIMQCFLFCFVLFGFYTEKQEIFPPVVCKLLWSRRLPAMIQPLNWCFSNPKVFSTRRFPACRLNSTSSLFYTQACRRYKSLHTRKLPWIGFIEEIMSFHFNAFQRNFLVCVISAFVPPCFSNPGPAKVCVSVA